MRLRAVLSGALVMLLALSTPTLAAPERGRSARDGERVLPKGFVPAVVRSQQTQRWFVQMRTPSVVERNLRAPSAQRAASADALSSQTAAIRQVESLGGSVVFRYSLLVNAFSVQMSADAARALAARPDVRLVEPVTIVRALETENSDSVPFIGATKVNQKLGVKGKGMTVAVVDTGVDYTHADFGGAGTVAAYQANDPAIIEPGTFPTSKVIGGYDFVGQNYDVLDDLTTNDVPVPDPDPLDDAIDGQHGSHVAGTCCGIGVPGSIGPGVAPKAKILAVKVWESGNSTADVLVAGYEFSVDPNQDGSMDDAADVLSFSGGVDYGPPSSTEAIAAEAVVKAGTVFVAAAGNAGNQPNGGSAYILGTPAAAPHVIAVAASIDQYEAQQLIVNTPTGVVMPFGGLVVQQDWAPDMTADITADIVDARAYATIADPSGAPSPSDRILCDSTPAGTPFAGKIAFVFKGPFGAGDCLVDDKVLHAQEAGAIAVLIWNGFGGLASQYSVGTSAASVTIPAVDLSQVDAEALAAAISPNAPASYDDVPGNVTITADQVVIPGFEDHMADFSSEGPTRTTNQLKPDVAAPGVLVTSVAAGTGTGSYTWDGTSMATPHVSGVATLLREIHPTWSPARIKAAIMNQATQDMRNLDGSGPVPATVMGSGRVQAFQSAIATNLAMPGSISLGLVGASDLYTAARVIRVFNMDTVAHTYRAVAAVRYTDFNAKFSSAKVSVNEATLSRAQKFIVPPGKKVKVVLEVTLDPGQASDWQQEWGWYYFNPNVDGQVTFTQLDGKRDRFHVPWHAAALPSAETGMSVSSLDLTAGPQSMNITEAGLGVPYADLYQLGAESPVSTGGEEDLAAIGARSFTGSQINGNPELLPNGVDPFAGYSWQDFIWADSYPTEPIEFVAAFNGIHDTTETLEVDVMVDLGADGVFADPALEADALVVKLPGEGLTCVFNLPSDFSACDADYYADYSNYSASVTGMVVDAGALGITNGNSTIAYGVVACTGEFAGDVPTAVCDSAGDIDPVTGTYAAVIDVKAPPLALDDITCRGFFGGDANLCDDVVVDVGSAAPGDDPSILAVFPNNAPGSQHSIITTTT
ncbi:MAG: S8 family serine peptidase [Solirubrobacterales bacterium]